jgi:hypothetical protein
MVRMRMAALRPQVLKVRLLKVWTVKVRLVLPMALPRRSYNQLDKALKQL